MNHSEMILAFPREIKLSLLKDALKQDKIGIFIGLSKILLDAPISKGGIESEVIDQIHEEFISESNNKES